MDVTIRPATAADIPDILAIVNHAIAHTTANYDYHAHTLAEQQQWFDDKVAKDEPVIVAVHDSEVVGFGAYGRFKNKIGYQYSVEHSVYVRHDLTGKGIGRLLLLRLIEIAKQQRMHTMVGYIDAENTGSIAFHKRLGFVQVGQLNQIGFKFNRWLDVAFLQLMLD